GSPPFPRVQKRTHELEQLNSALFIRKAELKATQIEVLERLAQAAEFHDDNTGQHTRRVGEMSGRIAEALGWKPARVELLRLAAPLHDVGKIAVPDSILLKPGKLTDQEFAIIKQHPEIGARLLQNAHSALVSLAHSVALNHHERFDGTGYPHRLRGEAIPLVGRIVAVADVFDGTTFLKLFGIGKRGPGRALHFLELHQVRGIVIKLCIDQHGLSDGAVQHRLPQRTDRVRVQVARCTREHAAAISREREQLLCLAQIGGRGLLGVDMLARDQCALDGLVMRLNAREVDYHLDRRICQQRVVARIDRESIVGRNRCGSHQVEVEDSADFQLWMGPGCAHVDVEDIAAADVSDLHPEKLPIDWFMMACRMESLVCVTARLSLNGMMVLSVAPRSMQARTSSA
ncbi:MAG: HD domain-containing protein, partial [Alphaproteobacteria bacterium]